MRSCQNKSREHRTNIKFLIKVWYKYGGHGFEPHLGGGGGGGGGRVVSQQSWLMGPCNGIGHPESWQIALRYSTELDLL